MYKFLKIMWIMKRIDSDYLQHQVELKHITQKQCNEILQIQQK